MRPNVLCVITIIAFGWTQIAKASQELASVEQAAAIHAESRARASGFTGVAVDIRSLDSRIDLRDCDSPLSVAASNNSLLGAISVAVSCKSPEPWTLHVRGTVSAQVELPVAAIPINRGDIFSASDVKMERQRITRDLVGYIADPHKIIGMEARKHLSAGSKVRTSDIIAPRIIERGQTIDLIARSSGLIVNMQGEALANGAAGERLLVRNVSSGKRIEGLVLSSGSVLIQ